MIHRLRDVLMLNACSYYARLNKNPNFSVLARFKHIKRSLNSEHENYTH